MDFDLSKQMEEGIISCLAKKPQGGNFQHGDYSITWATGMGSSLKQRNYKERFGSLPQWVLGLHPWHIILLCDLSSNVGLRLPDERHVSPWKGPFVKSVPSDKDASLHPGPITHLPERPTPFDSVVGWEETKLSLKLPIRPSKEHFLGCVEWAWQPLHGRVDAYYLNRGRTHWSLWQNSPIESDKVWSWTAIAGVALDQASSKEAAVHLLIDYLRFEGREYELDRFHFIASEGELVAEEIDEIGNLVWPT